MLFQTGGGRMATPGSLCLQLRVWTFGYQVFFRALNRTFAFEN
ncbi:hypothetical protein E2C01_045448 [Portunus trituberculatus]|uniref:Uncharacterized protein n=1 Tax=Portunus trituberculatus TaxID=210409 RepID=A0A5B7G241_PORTR|nr:hypothetical protein [Portunus trituberculatus]